jgi:subtilisin family serine protease
VRPLVLLILCALAGAALAAPASAAVPAQQRILLERRPGLDAEERADLRADAGVTLERTLSLPRIEVVRAEPGERAEALAALRADDDVVWAEPDRPRRAATADPLFGELWGLPAIRAPQAWTTVKGAGATVAVVDTGVDLSHPDLSDRLVAGWDYVGRDAVPQDGNGHGTHVAGTIAASENTVGVVGVAPQASVQPLRVLDDDGGGYASDVTAAFDAAGDAGIRVVSASLGSPDPAAAERAAIHGHPQTLYVVAAGNDGTDLDGPVKDYPCAYDEPNILCVGASDEWDAPAPFSNVGATTVDLFAPGTRVLSDYPANQYAWMAGTSMATPHVSGAAALLFALHPGWTAAQVKQALMEGAERVPALTAKAVTGGRLDVAAALGLPAPVVDEAPAVPAAPVAVAGDGQVALDWPDSAEADVTGYRIERATASSGFATVAESATSSAAVRGLANGVAYRFRVVAVDRAGHTSPPSAAVTATPVAASASTAPTVREGTAPAAADGAGLAPAVTRVAPAPAISVLRLTGRVRTCAKCRSTGRVRFRLAAEAWVTVRLERRTCRRGRCSWSAAGRTGLQLPAGAHRWTAGRRLAGLALRAGHWRLTLTTAAGSARLRFAAAAR